MTPIGTYEAGICGVEEKTGTVYCRAKSAIFEQSWGWRALRTTDQEGLFPRRTHVQ